MTLRWLAACFTFAILALVPLLASASELTLPARARLLGERVSRLDSYALPVGPFSGSVPGRDFEGRVERRSWRLDAAGATTLQVLAPLQDQMSAAGYDIVYDCRDQDCGGFDFRFGIAVIPAPDMHVNIRDYRYLGAVRGENEALSLLVSQVGRAIYVQMIHALPQESMGQTIAPPGGAEPQHLPVRPGALGETLQAEGHVVLADLVFETGAARLDEGPFASLEQLAGLLRANPDYRIALVGHTDSVGSLATNVSLSKRRAGAVRARMMDRYGIARERIEAEGMGYLAPVASNLTHEGREANRRVEAILLFR